LIVNFFSGQLRVTGKKMDNQYQAFVRISRREGLSTALQLRLAVLIIALGAIFPGEVFAQQPKANLVHPAPCGQRTQGISCPMPRPSVEKSVPMRRNPNPAGQRSRTAEKYAEYSAHHDG
jgi:hypothetical protein